MSRVPCLFPYPQCTRTSCSSDVTPFTTIATAKYRPRRQQLSPPSPKVLLQLQVPFNTTVAEAASLMATASTHSPASSTSSPLSNDLTCLSLGSGVQRTEFFLGPVLSLVNASPVHNIREHLAKRVDTDDFYAVKILTLSSPSGDSSEDRQGKVLLHNEYSLLLFLQGLPGVVHQHGLYREQDKIILVFDCIHSHNYDGEGRYSNLMNLQQYIVKQKRLKEREALPIFLTILTTIDAVHKVCGRHSELFE